MKRLIQIAWQRAYGLWYEVYLGINTRGLVAPPTAEGVHYTPLPYPMISRLLTTLELQRHDVFVDVGCGKGRVVCCVCRHDIQRVVALELNGALLQNALDNVSATRGRKAPVEGIARSAEEYDYADATVVYLYNPFNERLTRLVIERLLQSHAQSPRRMRIIYANPVHEGVLKEGGWLRKYAEWPANDFPGFGYSVSLWETL